MNFLNALERIPKFVEQYKAQNVTYDRDIPILQETVEVCEYFHLNPYQLASAGSFLMVTENAEALCQRLAEQGIPASIIGQITDNNDKIIQNGEEIRYIDRPAPDEIYKIFET